MSWLAGDWAWLVGGWVVAVPGAVLLYRAVLHDRSRGRKRCPKCWYAMDAVPGPTCPECGHGCSDERRLLRTRRRWGRAGVALAVVLLGLGLLTVPGYLRAGWYGLVPSSVLVYVAPADHPPARPAAAPIMGAAGGIPLLGGMFAAPSRPADLREEVWARLKAGRLARWQSQAFLERYLRRTEAERLVVPKRWVVGEPVPVIISSPFAVSIPFDYAAAAVRSAPEQPWMTLPSTYACVRLPLGGAAKGLTMEYAVRSDAKAVNRTLYQAKRVLPLDLRKDVASVLDVASDAELQREVAGMLERGVRFTDKSVTIGQEYKRTQRRLKCYVAFWATIELDGEVLGEAAPTSTTGIILHDLLSMPIEWRPEGWRRAAEAPEGVTIVIRSDRAAAGRLYLDARSYVDRMLPDEARCWEGTLRLAGVRPVRLAER